MIKAEVRQEPALTGSAAGTPRGFVRYAKAVLVFNVAVALWGAYVRASGSGAGCGNHWPLCNGEVTPHSPAIATIIEFTHRATSGIGLLAVAVLLLWSFRAFPRRHPARLAAVLSMVFVFSEALIGAALVLLGHVEKNASVTRAYSLSTHLINTLTLLACLTLTVRFASGRPIPTLRGRALWLAALSLGVVVLLGVSGAVAALGDTLFPSTSLAAGLAQDWDPSANIFLRLRGLHPLLAVAAAGWLLYYAVSNAARNRSVRTEAWMVVGCVGVQLVAGATNLLLLAPVWTQLLHLLLAYVLWVSLVRLCASLLTNPRFAGC
ncbi:MAG TPA: COX15/CtaA family protein [Bryobacteraceae bacterium]|nr:COX15/CtaA family protein [Bryobacteraceae bacterium]